MRHRQHGSNQRTINSAAKSLHQLRPSHDPALREIAHPYRTPNPDLIDIMFDVMEQARGVGLAAPQIGIRTAMFVAQHNGKRIAIANPTVTAASDNTFEHIEGCLSLPGDSYHITRHQHVIVAGHNAHTMDEITTEFTGYWAAIVQHETDHLNGICIDRHQSRRQIA